MPCGCPRVRDKMPEIKKTVDEMSGANEKKGQEVEQLTKNAFKEIMALFVLVYLVLELSWYYSVVHYGQGCDYLEVAYYFPFVVTILGIPIGLLLTVVFSILTWRKALSTTWALYGASVLTAIFLSIFHPVVDKFAMTTLVQRLEPIVQEIDKSERATHDVKELRRILKALPTVSGLHESLVANLLPKMKVAQLKIGDEHRCTIKLFLKMWTIDLEKNELVLKVAHEHTGTDPSDALNFQREKKVTRLGPWLRIREVQRDTGFVK